MRAITKTNGNDNKPTALPQIVLDKTAPFTEHDDRLRRYIKVDQKAVLGIQAHFSWVVMNDLWTEPMIWVDDNGVIYEDESEIPSDIKQTVSVRPKYSSQEAWIRSLEEVAPNFSRSTCFTRHRRIMQHMEEFGRSFDEALKSVMLSPGLIRVIRRSVMTEDGRLDEEAVNKLVAKTREARDQPTPREKVRKYMELKEDELARGETIPRAVTRDIRTSVFGDHTIVARWAEETSQADIAFYHETPNGEVHTHYLAAVLEDGARTSLPPVVEDWLDRKLRLTPVKL